MVERVTHVKPIKHRRGARQPNSQNAAITGQMESQKRYISGHSKRYGNPMGGAMTPHFTTTLIILTSILIWIAWGIL